MTLQSGKLSCECAYTNSWRILAGRIAGGRLEFECTLTRDSSPVNHKCRSYAKLIAGSLHDDCLLLHEPLVLEQFPSPYTAKFATKAPLLADSAAVHVVASVILDRLTGLDVTKQVTVPRTAKLQTGQPAAPRQQSDAAYTIPQQQTQPQQQQQQKQQQHGSASTAHNGSKHQQGAGLLQQGSACQPNHRHQSSRASTSQMPQTASPEITDGHRQDSAPTTLPTTGWTQPCQNDQHHGQRGLMSTAGQGKTASEPGVEAAAASGEGFPPTVCCSCFC